MKKEKWDSILKSYRIKNNLTQEELAEKIGITPRQVQRIENNTSDTKIKTLQKYIKILKIEDKDIITLRTKAN